MPRPFTPDRPAVVYTHVDIPMAIDDHPLASKLPKATAGPSLQANPDDFREFGARENVPITWADFTSSDTPNLSLHITSFIDATLVGLSFSHVMMDAMAMGALVHAWSVVLAGRMSDVPAVLGARECSIVAAVDAASTQVEELALEQKRLKGLEMAKFATRLIWGMLTEPKSQMRSIFLPAVALENLKRQAQKDLIASQGTEKTPYLSEGDVITAWLVQVLASSLPQPRPITVIHPLNVRFRLSSLRNAPGVYLQNMLIGAFAFFDPVLTAGPLGAIASSNRNDLIQQATEPQVLAYLRQIFKFSKAGAADLANILAGPSDALLLPFTNWSRANMYGVIDFSPAIIRVGESGPSRINPPGTLVYHHAVAFSRNPLIKTVMVATGNDHSGGQWLHGYLPPQTWKKVEESLPSLMAG